MWKTTPSGTLPQTAMASRTYSGFCLTALPHRKLPDEEPWERAGHKVRLIVEPGRLPVGPKKMKLYGVPYGSRARLILLYLQTKALQTTSREVELGGSMRDWMSRMNVSDGGKQYAEITEQANRISACNLTFIWDNALGAEFEKDTIIKGGFRLYGDGDDRQGQLWRETVRLSESFFNALRKHPVPIAEPALRLISNQSMAIDTYIWLAYRLHVLNEPTHVSWAALHSQFGAGFTRVRKFKEKFLGPLKAALAVYPDAKVTVDDDGLVLHPSRPPVTERELMRLA